MEQKDGEKPAGSRLMHNRWVHRRRMAYISLAAIIVATYFCLFKVSETRLASISDIMTWFYISMGSVVGAYVGFRTLDDKWQKKGE